jgi:hypothetical protein
MSSRELDPLRSLRVLPRGRGSWIVATERGNVVSEHATATDAEISALECLREGDELLVFDRYHAAIAALQEADSAPRERAMKGLGLPSAAVVPVIPPRVCERTEAADGRNPHTFGGNAAPTQRRRTPRTEVPEP